MNYSIHKNGWTVFLDDFDFKNITDEDRNTICKLLLTNAVVVCQNQQLSVNDEISILNKFDIEPIDSKFSQFIVSGSNNLLLRVTAGLDENGRSGLFNEAEGLPWHSDNPFPIESRAISWLYGVNGTQGSITSWCHTTRAFGSLDNRLKKIAKDLKATMHKFTRSNTIDNTVEVPLMQQSSMGDSAWMFPFTQIEKFKGMTIDESQQLITELCKSILKEEHLYHHEWKDGDVILFNQRNSIHKRWPFDNMESRLLHKAAMGFPKEYGSVLQ
jgi:taurine dioxygenase